MSDPAFALKNTFRFGTTTIQIIQGDVTQPGVEVDAIASTDDNYLTMGSGVSARLREKAASKYYIQKAQAQCPVKAGTIVVTKPYGLKDVPQVKWVLHGTAIDYDTTDLPLGPLVGRTTANCLAEAEKRGIKRILFPAFAAGAGKLTMEECARWMCGAIKEYVAQWRPIEVIYIILGLPEPEKRTPAEKQEFVAQVQLFCREANLVLDTPYDPASGVRQCRDFYGRQVELEQLEAILTGQKDENGYKRHAVILGGPSIGKRALLDQLFCRARKAGSAIGQGRCVVMLAFGRVHENTPPSFVYRKFLAALATLEQDESLRKDIRRAYGDPDLGCTGFLEFLDRHADRYPEVVFLVDHLPRLLQMEKTTEDKSIAWFWSDLDRLQERVRFVYTARDEEYETLCRERLAPFAKTFLDQIEEVRLTCLGEEERKSWVDALFTRYLGCPEGAPDCVHQFFDREAGLHPYLVSLTGYALVRVIKEDALRRTETHPPEYTEEALAPFFSQAHTVTGRPRRDFFDLLIYSANEEERLELENLARAIAVEQEISQLQDEPRDDRQAMARLGELLMSKPRAALHGDTLKGLQARGYLVEAESVETARFAAGSFATYVAEISGIGVSRDGDGQPRDVVITLLRPQPQEVMALFSGGETTIDSALKELPEEEKREFMVDYGRCIAHLTHPAQCPDPGPYSNLEQVGTHILAHFTTARIKAYLQRLPKASTISLVVDHALKDIPWELMLEPAYAGEIRFQIGRRIVGKEPASFAPPVRGDGTVKALLIGDPTDEIERARQEVEELAERLRADKRFEPVVHLGSAKCTRSELLRELESGQYGLVHYSGHSVYEGYQSAWQLKDGKRITTKDLTAALQLRPPVLVFSSSCESAQTGQAGLARYESQTFDLPSAFLTAGVQAYVGTLWEVEATAAYRFDKAFYEAFLSGKSMGECLRHAKEVCRAYERRVLRSGDRHLGINWLAFVLYGDPHALPGDLFPALRSQHQV